MENNSPSGYGQKVYKWSAYIADKWNFKWMKDRDGNHFELNSICDEIGDKENETYVQSHAWPDSQKGYCLKKKKKI